jgi:hypothetical protein
MPRKPPAPSEPEARPASQPKGKKRVTEPPAPQPVEEPPVPAPEPHPASQPKGKKLLRCWQCGGHGPMPELVGLSRFPTVRAAAFQMKETPGRR